MITVCHCCEPAAAPTPLPVENRPALSAVAYRIGTYASFREAMLGAIAGTPELAGLTTRRSDDYAITMMELWAAVADVLTFYQERYANEAFLRTAQFRDSMLRLVNLIGYRLKPGVAARTSIAFTLDKDKRLTIPTGQKVQSVPEAGQQPQTFETIEPVDADARLNRLRVFPPPITYTPLGANTTGAILDRIQGPSVAARLNPGDPVLLFTDGATTPPEEKKIAAVRVIDDLVTVTFTEKVNATAAAAYKFKRTFRPFGYNHPDKYMESDLPDPSQPTRIRWQLKTLAASDYATGAGNTLLLDAVYKDLVVGQKLLLADAAGKKTLVTITGIRQAAAKFKTMSESVTRLIVAPDSVSQVPASNDRRNVVAYELDGPALAFSNQAYGAKLTGDTLYLPGVFVSDAQGPGVEVGRTIERNAFKPGVVLRDGDIQKGRRLLVTDAKGNPVLATVKAVPAVEPAGVAGGQFCHVLIPLDLEGVLNHDAFTAALSGNVAEASHGETVAAETVGSGDASVPFQRLALRRNPLTYLPAATPEGMASTLAVSVNGVEWRETPQLYGQPGNAPVYEIHHADDGTATLQFGDGEIGARLPTGRGNVAATYRIGVGLAGRVPANSLTTLLQKPAGLSAAVNPMAAEGGADPETLDAARRNAPRTVRTFGRIVSLEDFEDQVTASGEVAKARATWVWDGFDRAVHLTVAGQAGATFSDQARRDLGDNLALVRDTNHRLRIDNYTRIYIEFTAGIGVDPAYDRDQVTAAAREAVLAALSFDNLNLGQPVNLSDLYRVVQDVPGVLFVDVDRLMFKKPAGISNFLFVFLLLIRGAAFLPSGQPDPVQGRLRIFGARPHPTQPGTVLPAELAAVEFPGQDVTITVRES